MRILIFSLQAAKSHLLGWTLLLAALTFSDLSLASYEAVNRAYLNDSIKITHTTLKSGAPVGDKFGSLTVGPRGPNLLADVAYLEETAHFNRERIPERVVHAKGAGALGEFVVTNTTLIAKYSKASLFGSMHKRTPVAVRFSHVTGESGIADTPRDVHGFAVKFYTEQGNWDLVGNNFPVFFVRDPINFSSFVHSQKRCPRTHLKSPDMFWDFIAMLPETMHTVTMLFSDRGTPDGFRHMHGYGVNTFKLVNAKGEAFYAKFHWICGQKIRNLPESDSKKLAGTEPDYFLKDLQSHIEKGKHPSWTLKFQVIPVEEAPKAKLNLLDATKTWPTRDYPLHEIGRMTLTKNMDNYFAQVEQLAFSPANMVPGIESSPDKMLMGRVFSYSDAQRYRLGVNYQDIPVNQPKCPVMTPTYCDGVTYGKNCGGAGAGPEVKAPNYVPSIKYHQLKMHEDQYVEHDELLSGHVGRFDQSKEENFAQARELIKRVMDEGARKRLAANVANHLRYVKNKEITSKVLSNFEAIDSDVAAAIAKEMKKSR